ncbi:TonB-dependent receptor [Aurantibacter sp.]|uniref:TonB-dependent receptor n=1 Tax=Aurantibacter sp. TaxID=2807103 RepID=UPI00326628B0
MKLRTEMYKHIFIIFIPVFLWSVNVSAQEEEGDDEDGLGTETVTVTKAYTPTISDAFKIKSLPDMNDSIVLQKKEIEYSIFSVPVASTFTPSKGKAATVKKTPPPILYNSYASVGAGNPGNVLADFYTSRSVGREDRLDVGLTHNSSRGDFDEVTFDNVFSDSKLDASYSRRDRDFDWVANVGFQHQLYNWYGTPEGALEFATVDEKDARQNYFMAEVGSKLNMSDSFFKSGELLYRRFWDKYKSGENRVVFEPVFDFPITDEELSLGAKVDWVNGKFANASLNSTDNTGEINYNNLQVGLNPNLKILRDDLTLRLGAKFIYGMDLENSDGSFHIYPDVTASYRLLDEVAIAYAGVVGDLRQNSYYEFVEENPFVSPTLSMQPTDQQYDAYVGLKGQLLTNLSYNIKGSYKAENRLPLYKLNPINTFRGEGPYVFGNSFDVFYDDVKTFGVFGELSVDVNRNFTLGVNAEYYSYNTETDNPAWNLPDLTGNFFMDYQIGEKWYMGANLFYVGKRSDLSSTASPSTPANLFASEIIELDSYFDANAHIGYRLNKQLSIFAKAANIANNNYQRWSNYQVQGLQILAGATYKFDF